QPVEILTLGLKGSTQQTLGPDDASGDRIEHAGREARRCALLSEADPHLFIAGRALLRFAKRLVDALLLEIGLRPELVVLDRAAIGLGHVDGRGRGIEIELSLRANGVAHAGHVAARGGRADAHVPTPAAPTPAAAT